MTQFIHLIDLFKNKVLHLGDLPKQECLENKKDEFKHN